MQKFWDEVEARIAQYDLLCHPFYKAWSAGELSRENLGAYAGEYYHHVAGFPEALAALHARLPQGQLADAVLENCRDEEGVGSPDGRSHAELWLDFADEMGAEIASLPRQAPQVPEVQELVATFLRVAQEGSAAEALAAFYAYESQVPRVAKEKARGLQTMYGASARACAYFTLHQTADVHHAQVWKTHLTEQVARHPEAQTPALDAATAAALALWRALDGIERRRMQPAA